MKIKTQNDVHLLDEKIKKDLGIDLSTYRNEAVTNQFFSLLLFPRYIASWVLRPILLSFILFILGYSIVHLVHVEYVIYTIIGLPLFLFCGISFGLLLLIFRLKKDIIEIAKFCLEMLRQIVGDLDQVNGTISEENKQEVLRMLFKGIVHIVVIPMLTTVLKRKIPIVGLIISSLFRRVLTFFSNYVSFKETAFIENNEDVPKTKSLVESYQKTIDFTVKSIDSSVYIASRVVYYPSFILAVISSGLLALFLYLIW